jgi:hypothetical protein
MKRTYLFLLISALVAPLSASAEDRMFVQVPATVDASANIPDKIRSECGLEMDLANHTMAAMSRQGSAESISNPEGAGSDKYVHLVILSTQGVGGGAWSGPKTMTIRAELRQRGKTLDSTVLSRSTNGGAFAGFKGTCSMFGRVTTTLGKDVAAWVARGPR